MPSYDEFREMFANASSQEKLATIRSESHRLLVTAYTFSEIMQNLVNERKPVELPDDFGEWCKKIADSIKELQDLIEASADEHRSVRQEELKKFQENFNEFSQKNNEERWQHYQQDLPELRKYKNLKEAIDITANRLGFSSLISEIKNNFLDNVYVQMPERRAHFSVEKSKRDSRYYLALRLEWLSDWRNIKWEQHDRKLTSSLDEAVTVMQLWLVEIKELQFIRQTFQWME